MKAKSKTFTADFFKKAGKKGGTSTAKRGSDFYKEIGSIGAKKRWALKKASDEAENSKTGMDLGKDK